MPFLNGIEAAKRIRKGSPSSRLIFLTQDNDAEVRAGAPATGGERYLLKSSAGKELLPAMVGLRGRLGGFALAKVSLVATSASAHLLQFIQATPAHSGPRMPPPPPAVY
ncbi:MAG: hypothetical protein C5B58_12490 [Acidobacteria bacterium]|nr:MAG: hypothetical protein C5B58_12490 [Acidobacteriota bacterium]